MLQVRGELAAAARSPGGPRHILLPLLKLILQQLTEHRPPNLPWESSRSRLTSPLSQCSSFFCFSWKSHCFPRRAVTETQWGASGQAGAPRRERWWPGLNHLHWWNTISVKHKSMCGFTKVLLCCMSEKNYGLFLSWYIHVTNFLTLPAFKATLAQMWWFWR